jgi:hypothetical protein
MDTDIQAIAKYPMESEEWIKTVLIGGASLLFSFLVVPVFLVSGYLVRAIRAGMDGADEPPVFDEWGEMLKEGFVASIIGFVYQIVPLIVLFVFVGGSIIAFATGSSAGNGIGMLGLFGGLFLWWILAIVFGFVGFAGVANYAKEGSFGAGFDFDVIRQVITSRAYLVAWAYVIALNIVIGAIAGALSVTGVGAILATFLTFYGLVIAGWLWGDGFAEAMRIDTTPGTDSEAATV